jgi:hypothetical protein
LGFAAGCRRQDPLLLRASARGIARALLLA